MAAGIYIHIPFCVQKCLYCDFVSGCGTKEEMQQYQNALLGEIESTVLAETVDSVFFGGGTPSVYPSEFIGELLELLQKKNAFGGKDIQKEDSEIEITMEANPGTLNAEKLAYYRKIGINRLSLGLQSANNEELKLLGRIHTYEQFLESFHQARDAGFRNINIDIMSAIPKQTIDLYRNTLNKVIKLNPEHISAYSLIVEEGTPFYEDYCEGGRKESELPDEDTERDMYYLTREELQKYGYWRYEISNYAKPGFECRHNLKYWSRENYYGFGAAASSLVNPIRYTNIRNRKIYQNYQRNPKPDALREEQTKLSQVEQMEEYMFLGLRKMKGISTCEFERLFQKSIESVYGDKIRKLVKNGLIEEQKEFLRLTERGIDISNMVLAEFLID